MGVFMDKTLADMVLEEMTSEGVDKCELEFETHIGLLEFISEARHLHILQLEETSDLTLTVFLKKQYLC
jgi:hypothetical protein